MYIRHFISDLINSAKLYIVWILPSKSIWNNIVKNFITENYWMRNVNSQPGLSRFASAQSEMKQNN